MDIEPEQQESQENILDDQLLAAVSEGNFLRVKELFQQSEKPDVVCRDGFLRTPLHLAAKTGNLDLVLFLLNEGGVWNATDFDGVTIGEYALNAGHSHVYKELINAGCRAELILSCLEKNSMKIETEPRKAVNDDYLSQKLQYVGDKLVDANGGGVMMGWEAPLMVEHAKILCQKGDDGKVGHILNVGFGLGLIDTHIQSYSPASHTIIEAHPDVYQHMIQKGWDKKPGVKILFGRWQDVLGDLVPGGYDGIFFDTYGEFYEQLKEFHEILGDYLSPSGTYSFFNGLGATNQFFYDVYQEIVKIDLEQIGFDTSFIEISIDPDQETWKNITLQYWKLKTYHLPICKYLNGIS